VRKMSFDAATILLQFRSCTYEKVIILCNIRYSSTN
jgi:hypothetical protein